MKELLLTAFKGKLSTGGIIGFLITDVLVKIYEVAPSAVDTFQDGVNGGSVATAVFGAGSIWGLIRKWSRTYKAAK